MASEGARNAGDPTPDPSPGALRVPGVVVAGLALAVALAGAAVLGRAARRSRRRGPPR